MKNIIKKSGLLIAILTLAANFSHAQLNGFVLTPSGTTHNFMKYVSMIQPYNGTNYITGFLTLSAYQVQLGTNYDPGMPVQKLQMQGGNILLCKTFNSFSTPDFNPTSKNGAILFSDVVTNTHKHGKWGIEYDNQYSGGGLNFFNPVSQLTSTRVNFNLFISNAGNVGVGIGDPTQKLDIDGNIRLRNNAIIGTWSNNSLTFNTNSSARMTIAADGNVAIGNNTDPQARLHIKAEGTQDAGILLEASGTGKSAGIFFTKSAVNIGTLDKDQPIAFFTAGTDLKMKITPEGNVGIGVASPLYKLHVAGNAKFDNQVVIDAGGLYVNGEVKAKKFHASISPFPDFVFEPGYKLLSINEVESFINQNGHLPGVPNAAEVEQNGIELGEMNALLLQKIEELTLYIIALEKKMQAFENAAVAK